MLLSIVGCGNKGGQTAKMDGIEFDSVVVDTSLALVDGPNAPSCRVNLSLQYIKGGKAQMINDTLIRSGLLMPDYLSLSHERIDFKAAVDSFVSRYLTDYKREYGPLYREDKEHGASYNCSYTVKTQTQSAGDDILNYIAGISTYGGGAYPVNQTLVLNFNMKTGHLIRLQDLFVPGYQETLKDLIAEQMMKKFKSEDMDELKKQAIFADGNIYVPENFMIGEDDITFIYCEDEVAPHAVGEIRLTFSKNDLRKILK